jgi:ketosteroid isomerase-like protein
VTPKSSDVVRAHFRTFGSGGVDAAAEFWHPGVEWRAVEAAADDAGIIREREALRLYAYPPPATREEQ